MAPIIEAESLELEAKRRDDNSWHPCHISLSSSNVDCGVIVNFENCIEEDIITNREEALTRLRFRSSPLQDGECFHIKEGECVLAMYKAQTKSMFLDAVVEKLCRVKHSNRVYCRCTFEIKWLNPELDGEIMTVPSKSIMRLSSKGIGSHPVFAAFMEALGPTNALEIPSFLSLFEETNYEGGLHGMLEKQIEEISRMADGSKECSADLLLEVKRVSFGGGKQSKASVRSHTDSNSSQNSCRRSTRSQNAQQTTVELKKESLEQVRAELKKELVEDKPFLSPLAARAALASLVHEPPVKPEFSIFHIERDEHENLVQKDSKKYIRMHSLDATCEYMRSDISLQDSMRALSNSIQKTDNDAPVESTMSRRSNSIRRGTTKKSKPKECTYQEKSLEACEKSEDEKLSSSAIVNNLTDTTSGKLNGRVITARRFTRSSLHKEISVPSDEKRKPVSSDEQLASPLSPTPPMHKEISVLSNEGKQGSSCEQLACPVNSTRFSRSSKQKEILVASKEGKQGPSYEKLGSPVNSTRLTRSSMHKDIPVASDDETRGPLGEQVLTSVDSMRSDHSPEEGKQGPLSKQHTIPVNLTRLTRSGEHKLKSYPDANQVLSRTILAEDTKDTSKEDFVTPDKSESKRRRPSYSPADSNTKLNVEKKRTRASCNATVSKEDSGSVLRDGDSARGMKKIAIRKKSDLRFSPRLRFLPKTRSQKNA